MPPLRLYGLALTVVIVSKQAGKVITGGAIPVMMILLETAGFPETQPRLEVSLHWMLSWLAGL